MGDKPTKIEELYKEVQKQGKDSVDHVVMVMKETKVIGKHVTEEAVKTMIGLPGDAKVSYEKFKEVMGEIAVAEKKHTEDLMKSFFGIGKGLFRGTAALFGIATAPVVAPFKKNKESAGDSKSQAK